MRKHIIYFLLLFLYLNQIIYADTYTIKLASYSNKENLLNKKKQLVPALQKNVILIEEDNLYKLFSPPINNQSETIALLPHYKKVFPDVYIVKDCKITNKEKAIHLSSSFILESNHSTPLIPPIKKSTALIQPISPLNHEVHSLHQLFANKTYFLSPNTIHSKSEKLLIQADFNTTDVNFTTIIGKVPPLHMPYMIQKNRLYFINNGHISPSQFSTLDKIYFEYMVISRWMKGKKIHQMRYYNKEDDAKSYLDSIYIP